jgi:MYXO-CTERM domain-containing protein
VIIEVEASDDDGVARVEFRLDGMPRGSDADPPYEHLWQTANHAGGSHTLTAVAYDTLDNPTEASVTVTVAAGGDADAGGGGGDEEEETEEEPERFDPISWGCSAPPGGDGGSGPAAALGLALVAALIRARRRGHDRSRRRRRRVDAQQRDGG